MNMESRNDLHRAEEFLAGIRVAQELDEFSEPKSTTENKEGNKKGVELRTNHSLGLNRNKVQKLRKFLAEMLLEYRKISSRASWSREDLMQVAIVEAKVHRLKESNLLINLNDIQSLVKLDMELRDWILLNIENGNLSIEPITEMKTVLSNVTELLQNAFRLFEQSIQNLDFPDASKQMFRLEELEDKVKNMPVAKENLIAKLALYQPKFQADEWNIDGRLQQGLLALDTIQDTEDSIGKLPHESIRDFIFQRGHFWERYETLYAERHERLCALIKNYHFEEKALQKALSFCNKSDYRKARRILNQTLGGFSELPYEFVQKAINELRIKALIPYQELFQLIPNHEVISLEALTQRVKDFDPIGEQKVKALAQSTFNPLRLFFIKGELLLVINNYIIHSLESIAKVKKTENGDLRNVLLYRWEKGMSHADGLAKKIRNAFNSKIIKNTMILSMSIICGITGVNLYEYAQRLPNTNLEFKLDGVPLDSLILEARDKRRIRFSSFNELDKQQIEGISPGKYIITANFINAFPLQIQKTIHIGQTTSLTKELADLFNDIKGTSLSVQAPLGSEIHITATDSDLETVIHIKPKRIISLGTRVDWLDFNEKNDLLLTTSINENAALAQISDGKTIGTFSMGDYPIQKAIFSPSGQYILTLGNQAWALWNTQGGHNLCAIEALGSTIICSAFRPNEHTLLTLNAEQKLQEWQVPTGKLLNELILPEQIQSDQKWAIAQVHPSWNRELSNGLQMRMDTTPRIRASLYAGTKEIFIAATTTKNQLVTWAGTTKDMKVYPVIIPNVKALEFNPSGEYLVAAESNGQIHIANLRKQEVRTLVINKGQPVERFAFSKSGDLLATSSIKQLKLLSVPSGKQIHVLQTDCDPQGPLAIASDGKCFTVGENNNDILMWKKYSTRITRLPPGEYTILVEKNGKQLIKENVVLKAGNALNLKANSADDFPLALK